MTPPTSAETPKTAWEGTLAERLRAGPDPERAAGLAARVLGAAPADEIDRRAAKDPDTLARVLGAVCGVAPFLAPFLERHPEWLASLLDEDYAAPLGHEELAARLAAARRAAPGTPLGMLLRQFKYRTLARTTARDASPEWLPLEHSAQTLQELSTLADVLLDEALRAAAEEVEHSHGAPRWRDAKGEEFELGLCVLGLGKLGANELNYSSDVDLIYVHATLPDGTAVDGPSDLSPLQYFTRVAQSFGRLVSEANADGFLYRVDLDLRPQGAQGLLVISDSAIVEYYERWAETWEKAAFMKARPVAGDHDLGWRVIRAMAPMLYRSSMDFGSVRGIRSLKDKIEASRQRSDGGFDVKVGVGGIRDVEFVAQALQLLHGGRIPQLRERSTARCLEQIGTLSLLPETEARALLSTYLFLRRLENRLQMEGERQTHLLTESGQRRLGVARALAYEGTDDEALAHFERDLAEHRERARNAFQSLLPDAGRERILDLFSRSAPRLAAFPTTQMIAELAAHFARELESRGDPERGLNNLARFVESVGSRRFYYDLLIDRPELVARLAALFDASNYLSSILASQPGLIEPVFSDPEELLLSREALADDLNELEDALRAQARAIDPVERSLDSLRLFHHRQMINIGLLDLDGTVSSSQAEGALTDVAEVCLDAALRIARTQLESRLERIAEGERIRFLVIGMGKLATRELSYGSDLDLIFLFDVDDGDDTARMNAIDYCVRLAQRLIAALQTTTAEGSCYEIDARLRPSGNQGTLVTSLAGFARYHAADDGRSAEAWERQALLRARAVAGDSALADRFEALRSDILEQPSGFELRQQIHDVRMRMERELAQETHAQRDFKTGRGGVLDVESIVQYAQLTHGTAHPELLEAVPLALQLGRLETMGLLPTEHAQTLTEGWQFLKALSSRLRIVENRSISELDRERGDLEGLALRMGYTTSGREGGARRALLADYARHTDAIRSVYEATFGAQDASGTES